MIKERHRKVAQVEQPRIDVALLEVLENPLRWFFRKTTLAGTTDDHRNYSHLPAPCGCSDSSVNWNHGSSCIIRNYRSVCQDPRCGAMRADAERNKKLIVQA